MFPSYQNLVVDVEASIAVVTLRNGERNGWNATLQSELYDVMRRCDGDDDVRAIVLTGAGRVFSVGADMAGGRLGAGATPLGPDIDDTPFLPNEVRKPVIAAINGDAVGAGTSYPLLCDIRLVADDAKMGFVFVRRGVLPEYGATWVTPRLVGLGTAAELLLTGRIFTGQEAAAIGVCTRALPKADVLDEGMRLAREIAEKTAPQASALVKRLLWQNLERGFAESKADELAWFAWTVAQADSTEGVMSFLEKRTPQWQGKVTDLPER